MDYTVVISSRIGLDAVQPVVDRMLRRGVGVHVVASNDAIDTVQRLYQGRLRSLQALEHLARPYRKIHKLQRVLELFVVPPNYSAFYRHLGLSWRLGFPIDSWKGRLFLATVGRLPKWTRQTIDRRNHRFMRLFVRKNPFPTSRILVVSFLPYSCMLCAPGQKVITYTESWDHATKVPTGYLSHLVFVWNRQLAHDWREFHGPDSVEAGYPVKLRYVIEDRLLRGAQIANRADGAIMYAATNSSNSDPQVFAEELEVIRQICEATQKFGEKLFIKPKPNGRRGDFDRFAQTYAHVSIGQYVDSVTSWTYTLDADYNEKRCEELAQCRLVLSIHTTFCLDAAAYGLPVMQFAVDDLTRFPALTKAMDRHHIRFHLLGDPELVYTATRDTSFQDLVEEALSIPRAMVRAAKFSAYLRDWLRPQQPFDASIERIVDLCLHD